MGEPPAKWVDADAVARVSGGLPGAFARLSRVFSRTLPLQLAQTRALSSPPDYTKLHDAAHTLFATVAAFSTAAGERARHLQDAAVREDLPRCTDVIAELDVICDELMAEVGALAESAERVDPASTRDP